MESWIFILCVFAVLALTAFVAVAKVLEWREGRGKKKQRGKQPQFQSSMLRKDTAYNDLLAEAKQREPKRLKRRL